MKNKQIISLFFILLISLLIITIDEISAAPYRSYNYDYWGQVTPAPEPYLPDKEINLNEYVTDLRDLYICDEGKIWVADSGKGNIVVLTLEGELIKVFNSFETNEGEQKFNAPQSVYVNEMGEIFIADTGNQRLVVLDSEFNFLRTIQLDPEEVERVEIFQEGFRFRPRSLGMGIGEKIYVISTGVYDGIMEFTYEGEFKGFIGAPRVAPSLVDIFWSKIATSEQRLRRRQFIPVEFSRLDIDERGFIYATVSGTDDESEAVKRLSPSGVDILHRSGKHDLIGDINTLDYLDPYSGPSQFIDITARPNGLFSVLDSNRGRIFTYDKYGNLLYVFGGPGNFKGMFVRASAIEHYGETILVADRGKNIITIFQPTEYARAIHEAIDYYERGHFNTSADKWRQVLNFNSSYEMAYTGIGKNYFLQEQFEDAMHYFRLGEDRDNYSKAYEYYRADLVNRNASNILFGILLLSLVGVVLARFRVFQRLKSQVAATKLISESGRQNGLGNVLKGLSYAKHIMFRPFDGFWDLKHEKRGNATSATILLLLLILSLAFSWFNTGFLFNTRDVRNVNVVREVLSILLTFGLWCVVNWGFTTLTDGKGNLKDIYIYSAYALTPITIITVITTIASNYMILGESYFYYLFISISVIWSMGLLFVGTIMTHDYTPAKGVLSIMIIVIGLVVVAFIGLLFFMIIDRLIYFFIDLYHEIIYRV